MNKIIRMSDILAMTDAELEHLARHGVGGYKTLSAVSQDVVREELVTLGPQWRIEWRGQGFNVYYGQDCKDWMTSAFFDDDHVRLFLGDWPNDTETTTKFEYASPSFPKAMTETIKAHLRKIETQCSAG